MTRYVKLRLEHPRYRVGKVIFSGTGVRRRGSSVVPESKQFTANDNNEVEVPAHRVEELEGQGWKVVGDGNKRSD